MRLNARAVVLGPSWLIQQQASPGMSPVVAAPTFGKALAGLMYELASSRVGAPTT